MLHLLNYINGVLVPPASGQYLDNFNPALGEVYSLIPDSDERDVAAAQAAAQAAFPAWSTMPKEKRSALLLKLSGLIQKTSTVSRSRSPWIRVSRSGWRKASTFPVRFPISIFMPPASCTIQRRLTRWKRRRSTTPCGHPSVSPVVSRPGTCRSTSSPGRSPRRLHRDARSWPNHPRLRR